MDGSNLLVDALPAKEREQFLRMTRRVPLAIGQLIYEQGEPMHDAYFPISGAISILTVMEDGNMLELAVVGREGMLGFPLGLGEEMSPWKSIVEVPGEAFAVDRERLRELLRSPGDLAALLTHYAGLLLDFAAQSGACNHFHPLNERCARWLMLLYDRAAANEFPLTHEFLAQMLGSHRPSVTLAMRILRHAGLIEYQRGVVRILDIDGLRDSACECYQRVQEKFERVVSVAREHADDGGMRYPE